MKLNALIIAVIVCSACALLPAIDTAHAQGKKHVMILNSYNKGYAWTDTLVKGIEDVLSRHAAVITKVEYMDTKLNNSDAYSLLLKQLYAAKYAQNSPDIIISSDDDALRFLRRYRDALFPGVPVVFCGVNNFTPSKVEGFSLYTGVNEAADFKTNLSLILNLHPDTRTIYVINDQLTTAGFLKQAFNKAADIYRNDIQFVFFDDISMADLKKKVSDRPMDSLIFYLSFFKDNTGRSYTPEEAIPMITQASSVPVYGAVDYMLGLGIVGGMLKSSYFQGDAAAKLALRVLDGEPISEIPVILKSPNQYMFDYRELKARKIDLNRLPADSLLINEPETFYYKYKQLIWTTACVMLTLVVFIVVLLFNIKKRMRAQRGLQTIISSTASILNYQSADHFRQELANQLNRLFPLQSSPSLFKHGSKTETPEKVCFPTPVSDEDQAAMDIMPRTVSELIIDSLAQNQCAVHRKNGVALFKSTYLPGNLAYLNGKRDLDDLDRDLLEIFTGNITMAIDNLEKHKIEKSLETANQIQMSMLPGNFEEFSAKHGIDLHAFLEPAREVGGDFYDFFAIDKDHLCFVVGDVSDKGVPAALFMAMAKSLIRSAAENNTHPEEIIAKANNALSRNNEQSMFVTVFLAVFNMSTHELSYTSAGHNPPYIVRADGNIVQVQATPGLVMGGFEGFPYITESLQLHSGDGLYIYTDGVTEAMDKNDKVYDEKRLEGVLTTNGSVGAEALNRHINDDLKMFVEDAPQSDDITMLFVRV